jgi:hypothetical protein
MNVTRNAVLVTGLLLLAAAPLLAQGGRGGGATISPERLQAGLRVVRLEASPAQISIETGQTATVQVRALDAQGNVVDAAVRLFGPRGSLRVDAEEGTVQGTTAGAFELTAQVTLPPDAEREPVSLAIPVTVTWPAVARVDVSAQPGRLYAGTAIGHTAKALHGDGTERPNPAIVWTSSDPQIATVDRFGTVTGVHAGAVTITAAAENARSTVSYTVAPLSVQSLALDVSSDRIRTGDVVALSTQLTSSTGEVLTDVPLDVTFTWVPDDSIAAPGAGGLIVDDRFVAEVPGVYTVLASAGGTTTRRTIDVRPREAVREMTMMAQGTMRHVHTSDLWIYEGVDGRDYAVTGTHSADGRAYFWDVTDESATVLLDSIQVDARTVNDVKVAPNGRYAALSREGASNRRNGVVLIDLANPRQPKVAGHYEVITGGTHNMFATNDYLFALSGGDKYEIIDVRDLANPVKVSEYDHPDSRIHDVWVTNGLAFSSEWGTGVVVVDVGNGKWGGTIENPKFVTNIPYPVGRTHAAFPYFQQSTGKFYLFLGDEILNRRGAAWAGFSGASLFGGGRPSVTSGYYHIIDFTDPDNPKDVARYEAKEFGTHNLWVEDDILYAGYYEGGMRVVDVSGELLGDLGNQGREIAVFKSYDPEGFTANAPFVWGAQPYKGRIFFSDFNSGLWSVRLAPARRAST